MIASLFAAVTLSAGGADPCPVETAALSAAASEIERRYVLPEPAARIAEDLRRRLASGAYRDVCGDPAAFIDRVNRDLDAHDGHFHFERPALTPATGKSPDADWLMAWRAGAREANAGVREARVLDGNLGYLRISSFYPWDLARPKFLAAFALLSDVDGLILDLRQNGGGEAGTAGQLLQALLGGRTRSVQDIERRSGRQAEALPDLELAAFPTDRPVAVIIDRRSASASEFVAYALQAAGRAIVVGDRSAGVAHMFGEPAVLPGRYALTIPEARPLHRTTGGNWEGTGVTPDLPGGDDPLHRARRRIERQDAVLHGK